MKLGIVGGVSWPGTVHYYGEICRRSEVLCGAAPEITVESLQHHRAVALIGSEDEASWQGFDSYHRKALRRLALAKCDVAMIASNSPHQRLSVIAKGVALPIIDLFEELALAAQNLGMNSLLVLGTKLTMGSSRLRACLATRGITMQTPDEVHWPKLFAIMEKLQHGPADGSEAAEICRIAKGHASVALACSEFPLAFPDRQDATFQLDGKTFLSASVIHIEAAVRTVCGNGTESRDFLGQSTIFTLTRASE